MKKLQRITQFKARAKVRWMLMGALLALTVAAMACSPKAATPAPAPAKPAASATANAPAAGTPSVKIQLFAFAPSPLMVKVGTKVTWTNADDIEHSVTQGKVPTSSGTSSPVADPGGFNSGFLTKGQAFSQTFDKAGAFMYFCMRHNSMTGEVDVTQ